MTTESKSYFYGIATAAVPLLILIGLLLPEALRYFALGGAGLLSVLGMVVAKIHVKTGESGPILPRALNRLPATPHGLLKPREDS
jgi:hypothetical protein